MWPTNPPASQVIPQLQTDGTCDVNGQTMPLSEERKAWIRKAYALAEETGEEHKIDAFLKSQGITLEQVRNALQDQGVGPSEVPAIVSPETIAMVVFGLLIAGFLLVYFLREKIRRVCEASGARLLHFSQQKIPRFYRTSKDYLLAIFRSLISAVRGLNPYQKMVLLLGMLLVVLLLGPLPRTQSSRYARRSRSGYTSSVSTLGILLQCAGVAGVSAFGIYLFKPQGKDEDQDSPEDDPRS
jgi:hypothetical protein